ncbi:hypothetical protein BDW66DRAFT_134391 [Aspergillus desertorum]
MLSQELTPRFNPVLCRRLARISVEKTVRGEHVASRRRKSRLQMTSWRSKILLLPFTPNVADQGRDVKCKLPRFPELPWGNMQRLACS